MKLGFITGRWQPYHNGHIEYSLLALAQVDRLLIGVCNPDTSSLKNDRTSSHRHLLISNPFSFYERLVMIRSSLLKLGVTADRFEIVPCFLDEPDRMIDYIPVSATHFSCIYDDWGWRKKQLLEKAGYKVKLLQACQHLPHRAKLPIGGVGQITELPIKSGAQIRQAIAEGQVWQKYVPQATTLVVKQSALVFKLTT